MLNEETTLKIISPFCGLQNELWIPKRFVCFVFFFPVSLFIIWNILNSCKLKSKRLWKGIDISALEKIISSFIWTITWPGFGFKINKKGIWRECCSLMQGPKACFVIFLQCMDTFSENWNQSRMCFVWACFESLQFNCTLYRLLMTSLFNHNSHK